jgi:hypothetical protein
MKWHLRSISSKLCLIGLVSSCSSHPQLNYNEPSLPFRTVASLDESQFAGGTAETFALPKRELSIEEIPYVTIYNSHPDIPLSSEITFSFIFIPGLKCQINDREINVSAQNQSFRLTNVSKIACASTRLLGDGPLVDQLNVNIYIRRQNVSWDEIDQTDVMQKNENYFKSNYKEIEKTLENLKKGVLTVNDFQLLDKVYYPESIFPVNISGQWTYYSLNHKNSAGMQAKKEKNPNKKADAYARAAWTVSSDKTRTPHIIHLNPGQSWRVVGLDSQLQNEITLRTRMGKAFPGGNENLKDSKKLTELQQKLSEAQDAYDAASSSTEARAKKKFEALGKEIAILKNKFAFPDEVFHSLVCAEDLQNGASQEVIFRGAAPSVFVASATQQKRSFFCQLNDLAYDSYTAKNHYKSNSGQFTLLNQIIHHGQAIKYLEELVAHKQGLKDNLEKQLNLRLAMSVKNTVAYNAAQNATANNERLMRFRSDLEVSLGYSQSRITDLEKELATVKANSNAQENSISALQAQVAQVNKEYQELAADKVGPDNINQVNLQRIRDLESQIANLEKSLQQTKLSQLNGQKESDNTRGNILFPEKITIKALLAAYRYNLSLVIRSFPANSEGRVPYHRDVAISEAYPIFIFSNEDLTTAEQLSSFSGDQKIKRFNFNDFGFTALPTKELFAASDTDIRRLREEVKTLNVKKNVTMCWNSFLDVEEFEKMANNTRQRNFVTYEEATQALSKFQLDDYEACFRNSREKKQLHLMRSETISLIRENFNFKFALSLKKRDVNGIKVSTLFIEGEDVEACYTGQSKDGASLRLCTSLKEMDEYHPLLAFKVHTHLRPKSDNELEVLEICSETFSPAWINSETQVWPESLKNNVIISNNFEEVPGLSPLFY